jgi:hypothetical protein
MSSATTNARRFLKEISDKTVRVGWFAGNQYPDSNTPVAFVAYVNEYGGKRGDVEIPARAPMRTTVDTKGGDIANVARKLIAKGVRGELDGDTMLNQLGIYAQSALQETIGSGLPPPNAEATVHGMLLKRRNKETGDIEEYRAGSAAKENRTFGQGKGFNKPLIDTGHMSQSVAYTVE